MRVLLLLLSTVALCTATVYFKEEFGEGWESRWVQSKFKDDYGTFVASAGKFFGDEARDTGLQTSQDARFYSIASSLDAPFSNKGKDFVVQFTVKHEQSIDCGGGYLKLAPSTVDVGNFNGDTEYNIMFGPDICGATKRTHAIINYKGENHLRNMDLEAKSDELSHLYTFVLHADQTYEVLIDQASVGSGSILDDWALLPPKTIPDPAESKPADWVDEAMMADPEDVKPAGWDDIPEYIEDPDAEKPDDWDDEDDGEWEPPTIENPEYKGEWAPNMIDNPDYKGPWIHPEIANPDYEEDTEIYAFEDFGVVGIDIWQVKSGTIFDNIIITDSIEEANEHAKATWALLKAGEKVGYDKEKAAKSAAAEEERAKRDAEIAEMEAEEDDEDDIDDVDAEKAAQREAKLEALKNKHSEL